MRTIISTSLRRVFLHTDTKRLFLAIPITSSWRHVCTEIALEARTHAVIKNIPAHWTPEENFHITVRFIGNVDKHCISGLIQTIRRFARTSKPFLLPLSDIHTATSDDPKMIWVTFRRTFPFQQIVKTSTDRIADFLYKRCNGMVMHNGHDVIPHITIARFKKPVQTLSFMKDFPDMPDTLPVTSLVLYESKTYPSGSVYRKIASFPLPS